MTRIVAFLALSGCGASDILDNGTDLLWMNPLCLAGCVSSLSAADTDTLGEANTTSTTQTTQTGMGSAQ